MTSQLGDALGDKLGKDVRECLIEVTQQVLRDVVLPAAEVGIRSIGQEVTARITGENKELRGELKSLRSDVSVLKSGNAELLAVVKGLVALVNSGGWGGAAGGGHSNGPSSGSWMTPLPPPPGVQAPVKISAEEQKILDGKVSRRLLYANRAPCFFLLLLLLLTYPLQSPLYL